MKLVPSQKRHYEMRKIALTFFVFSILTCTLHQMSYLVHAPKQGFSNRLIVSRRNKCRTKKNQQHRQYFNFHRTLSNWSNQFSRQIQSLLPKPSAYPTVQAHSKSFCTTQSYLGLHDLSVSFVDNQNPQLILTVHAHSKSFCTAQSYLGLQALSVSLDKSFLTSLCPHLFIKASTFSLP